MQQETITVTVAGPPSREIKRLGRWYRSGTTLEISRAEYEAAPPGTYSIPGEPDLVAKSAQDEKRARDAAEREEKMRRIEENKRRLEEAAARNAKILEDQALLAKAGVARLKQQNRERAK